MNKLDLTEEYYRLNKLIFSHQLPADIKIRWNNSKTCLGKTRIQYSVENDFSFQIYISRFFLCTDEEYIETLIHEMIHVLIAINGEYRKDKGHHGPVFKKYMNKINIDFPQYTIKIKEDGKIKIDESKIPLQNGFFLITESEKKYFNLYNKEIDKVMIPRLIKFLSTAFKIRKGKIYTFQGKYSEIATAPVRKNLKTLSHRLQYLHDHNEMDSLHDKIKIDYNHLYEIT